MALTVAIQMDPIEKIDIGGDSTFALALEAQARGHGLLYYGPRDLTFREGKVTARVRPLNVRAVKGDHFALGEAFVYDLSAADVVLMRQDPPFDMAYITATHILERIHPKTLVVNDPARSAQRAGKTVRHRIRRFHSAHPDHQRRAGNPRLPRPSTRTSSSSRFTAMAARAFSASGPMTRIWVRCWRCSPQFYREPVIVQRYLPEVRKGDKRIILVDGEFAGAINRVPAAGEARSNMHVGGRPEKTELTARERDICAAIGPELKRRGLIFTGIDVIGDYMTEINVTSPTGIQEVRRFGGADIAALVWDADRSAR